ncbi:hypothetical protein BYT27DRAFT_7256079 [Phlegmacium glaucopus]|nr:hypothetical protein BYT27DRAFT_7256079 [Phlegmacium glaucopus]
MRPISLLSIMALCLATGSAGIIMGEQQPMREDAPIHTKAGWEYIDCGNEGMPVKITSIQVLPDPPKPGKDLTVIVDGTVTETLETGAYADVSVKLGLIKLLQKRFDLCEEARKANATVQCPVKPGSYHVEHTVALPEEIPPAKFVINVRGYTVEDDDLVCLDLKVDFMPHWLS